MSDPLRPDDSLPDDSLRVLFWNSIPEWGGGERWCVDTALALSRRGHKIAIAGEPDAPLARRAREAGIETWERSLSGAGGLRAAFAFGARMRREGFAACVANVGRDVRLAAVACARSGAALVQRRGVHRPLKRDPLARRLYRKNVARVVANSEAMRAEMLAGADFVDPAHFRVIPNGIEPLEPDPAAAAAVREALELTPAAPLVAVVGRLAPMKGHAVLFEAWGRVATELPEAALAVVGSGGEEQRLRALAAELGIAASVRFLGFRRDVPAILAAADLLALPSIRDEGTSNTLLQAMALGRPAVTSDLPGLVETAGDTALVVPAGQSEPLADALVRLLQDAELCERLGRAARERARTCYSMDAATDAWERLLREVRGEVRPEGRQGSRHGGQP